MHKNRPVLAQTKISAPSPSQDILTAAKGGGILFFGHLFEYASRFIFGIIVARSLGADGYGLYTLGVATSIALASFARLGLSEGLVRFLPAALRERDEARAWGILQVGLAIPGLVGLGLGMILFGLANFLAENLFHEPAAAPILRWISISIPLIAIGRVLVAATRGFKRMQYETYANGIAFNLSRISLTVLLLGVGLGVPGALAAYALAWVVTGGLLFYFLNRLFSLKRPLRAAQRNVREMLSFSAPVCLTQVITQLGGELELLLLGMLGTMASVGVYSAALRVQVVGAMFLMAADMVAKPIISDLHHQGETTQLGRLYQTLTRWSLSFVLPYFLTAVLFARPILAIFGKEFEAGMWVLTIVSLGTLVNAGTGICNAMIIMTGHSKLTFLNSAGTVILNLILNLILIPVWGLVGAAVATALAMVIVNVARLLQVYWLLKLWPYNRTFVKPLIASAAALITGLATSRLIPAELNLFYLILNVAVLWSIYVATIVLLGLSAEDRAILSHTKGRFGAVLVRR
jgi:O-antigen/teichoic acid export membrane protein